MTDLECWQQLKRGERQALEQIYRGHVELLLRYGERFAADGQLVEDCVQDLFVDLWRRRESLSDTDSIRAYLLVALRRRIVRQIDRQRRHASDVEPEEAPFTAELAHDELLAAGELSAEQSERLRRAMAELSDRQREILYLKYYAELDYEAIGEIMDLNYQSARNLVSRALTRLKDLLGAFLLLIFWKILSGG